MYTFTPECIFNASKNLINLDDKVGGLICILSTMDSSLTSNKIYKISLKNLKLSLQKVFDISIQNINLNDEYWYIVLSKNWINSFFEKIIKNKIDLLSIAVFFLRRESFEMQLSETKIIDLFINKFNLQTVRNIWFYNEWSFQVKYNQTDIEINQKEFYKLRKITTSSGALKFNGTTIIASATELQRCAQIQTLYAGMDMNSILLLNKNDLSKSYNFTSDNILSSFGQYSNQQYLQSSDTLKDFSQTIYYGVPGSGKSHEIDEITKGLSEEQKMRVVFHPEYTNADFVGQILPSLNEDDGKIDYKFKPGPFTKILRRAYLNPSKKYFLIIEEINRGNAAAIFGDLFQLLDRISESSSGEKIGNNSYGTGWSSYFVSNDSINAYIREYADSSIYSDVEECVVIPDENKNKDKISEKYSTVKIKDLTFTANTGIRLPSNLSILATMNTSDQNVFTLDNAFQRRWNMVLVKNEFKPESENQRKAKIAGSNVSWEDFHKKINAEISKVSIENNLSSMVDKRLGCWFAKAEKNKDNRFEIKKDDFENKILKYLWDDAFKFNREFFEPVENFEELLAKVNMEAENFGVFRNLKFDENKKDFSAETGENEQN